MCRGFTIVLLLVEALFFNVIIPGHARGMIELPGSKGGAACCAAKHKGSGDVPRNSERTSHCAVCAFAATMSVAPAPLVAPRPTGLAGVVRLPLLHSILAPEIQLTYLGRAPPVKV